MRRTLLCFGWLDVNRAELRTERISQFIPRLAGEKSQAATPNSSRSSKRRNSNRHRVLFWSLRIDISLKLGAWNLELFRQQSPR
jgi:hypothetical protein